MRVFLDTNVLVSAVATRGLSADVLRLVLAEHELITGEFVLSELRRVLAEKFSLPERRISEFEQLLRRYDVEPMPDSFPQIEVRGQDDASILASTLSARADILITGDKDLLEIRDQVADIRIVDPRAFWESVRRQGP